VTVLVETGYKHKVGTGRGCVEGTTRQTTPPQSALPVPHTHIAITTALEVHDSEDDGLKIIPDFGNNSPVQMLTNFLSI